MEISLTTKNSFVFFGFSSSVILSLWFFSTISIYWNSSYQAMALYECRWLLSSLIVTCFFVYIFIHANSLVMFTATYVSTQYSLVYSIVSVIFSIINAFHVFTSWPLAYRRETMGYLQLNLFIGFLSFIAVFLTSHILKKLIEMAKNMEEILQPFERKHQIMFCSIIHFCLGLLDFMICYEMDENAPYASSYIVQQVCCSCLSLSIACMQWYFRDACNTHILRSIVILNVCQFIQELSHAYSTYMLIMIMRRGDDMINKLNTSNRIEVLYILIYSLIIHGIRLITCIYPIIIFAKKAFPNEVLHRIQFLPDQERRISALQANRADNIDKNDSKMIFYCAAILVTLCIVTDIAYNIFNNVIRIGNTGISLLYTICLLITYYYYRRERRTIFLKLLAVLSIIILNASIHMIYSFGESLFTGQLYNVMNKSIYNFAINSNYFLIAIGLAFLSVKSAIFCFRTITKHTVLLTQPTNVIGPLRWLNFLAYTLIVIVVIEIIFTVLMYKFFSTKLDLVFGTELFLWINTISTCLLQIWICKHQRFQRCVIILIIQLLSDSLTILLLIMAQAGIVQIVVTMMIRHTKIFRHANARIFYIAIDHVLQIIQWALNICSLGLTLIVLDAMETGSNDIDDVMGFHGEIFHVPSLSELLTVEHADDIGRIGCSIYHSSTALDYCWDKNDNANEAQGSEAIEGYSNNTFENDNSTTRDDNNDGITQSDSNIVRSISEDPNGINGSNNIITERNSCDQNTVDDDDIDGNDESSDSGDSNIDYSTDCFKHTYDKTSDNGDLNFADNDDDNDDDDDDDDDDGDDDDASNNSINDDN